MSKNDLITSTSKRLSYVLRHDPGSVGLTLGDGGWVPVHALLSTMGKFLDRGLLDRVVAENNKKRFEFSEDGLSIRACQGHSVDVDLGYESSEPPARLYHGTSMDTLTAIQAEGIRKMNRHAVHLSSEEATAISVGGRHGRPVVLVVEAAAMCREIGAQFFVTANGVWLTDYVPPTYITFPEGMPS